MATREQIVQEARKWVGTPFVHLGRRRGLGIDCAGLVLCIARDLGLADWLEAYSTYSRQPVGDEVLRACRERLQEKQRIEPGDVIVFRNPRSACHAAIASDKGIIHAHAGIGRVVETALDAKWRKRIAGIFSLPGVE